MNSAQSLAAKRTWQALDPNAREKRLAVLRNYWARPENMARRSQMLLRPDVNEKLREGIRRALSSAEKRQERSRHFKQIRNDPEIKKRHADKMRELWKNPEFRKKRHDAMVAAFARPENRQRLIESRVRGPRHHFWSGGNGNGYPNKWYRRDFKKRIIEFFGSTCMSCGRIQAHLKHKLIVHHKNENKHDLRLENFTTVCRTCHMMIHHSTLYPIPSPS